MKISPEQITVFLVSISVMLFMARALGELFSKIKQAPIMGEILAGIVLGPTVLGYFFPGIFGWLFPTNSTVSVALDGITNLAVVMLLLVSGLEVDLNLIIKSSKTAFFTSILGILFPFAIGFGVSYYFYEQFNVTAPDKKLLFSLFIGTAMSISALPVIARTLIDLNIIKSKIGMIILASAMFNDLIGWILFSALLDMMKSEINAVNFILKLGFILLFVLFMLIIGRKLINKALPIVQNKLSYPGTVLNFIFIIGFLCAALTEWIGIHAIFGAFILGVAIGDTTELKESTRDIIHQFVTNIFAPLFFVSIGLKINIVANFQWQVVLIITLIAFVGKVVGCGLGAYFGGMRKNEAMVVGFGMNSRGAMEIIIALLALNYGLIPEHIFVAIVIMAIITSLSSAPLMSYFMRFSKRDSLKQLLTSSNIFIGDFKDKAALMEQMTMHLLKREKIDKKEALEEIMKREEQIPTGLGKYLALPHAKLNIKDPLLAIAISKTGIDFEAPDEIPARIIALLLIPKTESELQLKIMAKIAKRFREMPNIEPLLNSTTADEFLKKFIAMGKVGKQK